MAAREATVVGVRSMPKIDEEELRETFIRSSGPGGQHVNKTSSAVELRFDAAASPSLSPPVRARLLRLAGARATAEGVIIIRAQAHRSQELNRRDARARLFALIARAADAPAPRIATKPGKAAKARRVDTKTKRGAIKRLRGRIDAE
jgi:ribosome-associated protein